jgi:hypothetical protein
MRRKTWLAPAWAALALGACGSPSAPDAGWAQVSEHTSCEALLRQYCAGAFGFTVRSDGRFTVGPADNGATQSGAVTEAERAQLSADVSQVSANLMASPQCEPAQTIPGSSDQVDLTDARQGPVRVYDLGGTVGSVCYRGGRAQAASLHTDLAALTAKYYPRPFPPS